MCNICRSPRVLVYGNAETRPDERAGNNRTDGGDCPCQGGRRRGLGRALPGLRARDIPVLQARLADAGRCRRRHDGNIHETEGQAGAVRRDAVVLRLALQGGGESLLGYAAAAQDSSGQGNGRFGERAAGASGPKSTGAADRAAHQRRSAQGAGQTGRASTDGAGDALLLGYELRRNCGRAGSAPRLCGRGAAARPARTAASAGRQRGPGGGRDFMSKAPEEKIKHLDEMTLLLYIERQLDRARGLEVSAHTQECDTCHTLLRAMEQESRLLTRAMLEEDEPLPSRLAQFQERARKSMQWIWGVAFGLAATGVYALYTQYIQPWQQQLENAGFGGSNLLGLLIFQGAMWKGWQSMMTLLEVLAMVTLAGLGVMFYRRRIRRGSALALVLAGFSMVLALPTGASATEHRGGQNPTVGKDETIKGDVYLHGERVRVEGTVDGDVIAAGKDIDIDGHVTGDVISAGRYLRIRGTVDGNIRSVGNTAVISGTLGKNITWFGDAVPVDATGKVGGGITMFRCPLAIDRPLNRDLLFYGQNLNANSNTPDAIH